VTVTVAVTVLVVLMVTEAVTALVFDRPIHPAIVVDPAGYRKGGIGAGSRTSAPTGSARAPPVSYSRPPCSD
jgi:hypothetical protein